MTTAPDEDSSVEQALTGGALQRVGWYRFYFADERWEWSEEVEQIHGYQPGTVTPTTELVLSHKHPDDYPHIAATLDDIRRTHKPFSTRHRIITVQGDVRDVVVIGERFHDNTGEIVGTQGFYLDVTPSAKQRQESITEALAEIADHRAAIEQAKGVLMYVYGIGPDAAFDILKWRSQDANVKLRALAEQLSRRPHTQARRRLSRVAPNVRQAATHRPRTSQSPRCLSCDRRRPAGLRDYAMLTLLARVGLRRGEVAGLRLDDIDWRSGELAVAGKGRRFDRVPLPGDVGRAIVDYLQRGRPPEALDRRLFIRIRAPHRGIGAGGVTQAVAAAAERAGLGTVYAHRLGHTAATSMLAAGASLTEIGLVLRHRGPLTTSIYAKVDTTALVALARPWPSGGVS